VFTAYAGSAAVCPEFRGYLDSAELADLVSMNPHTWFLTNADYYCLWVARPHDLTSTRRSWHGPNSPLWIASWWHFLGSVTLALQENSLFTSA
jgi:hypothetical protein